MSLPGLGGDPGTFSFADVIAAMGNPALVQSICQMVRGASNNAPPGLQATDNNAAGVNAAGTGIDEPIDVPILPLPSLGGSAESSAAAASRDASHHAPQHSPPAPASGFASNLEPPGRGSSYAGPSIPRQIIQGIASLDPSASGTTESVINRYTRLRNLDSGAAFESSVPTPQHAEGITTLENTAPPDLFHPKEVPNNASNPEETDPLAPPSRPTNVGVVNLSSTVKPPVADPRKVLRWKDIIDNDVGTDPGAIAARAQKIQDFLSKEMEVMNIHTKKKRDAVLHSWAAILTKFMPDLHSDKFWTEEIVKSKASFYLTQRFYMTRGRSSHFVIAATVLSWLTATAWMITKFCHHPVTKVRTGMTLLIGGLFTQMETVVLTLIKDHKLVRYTKPQCYLGLSELRIIIESMIKQSEDANRLDKLQQMAAMTFAAFTAVRPSTLCANNATHRDQGLYLKLGDIKFLRKDSLVYDIIINATHFKNALTGPRGKRLEFVIFSLTKAQNAFLSGIHILLYVFVRGGFGDMSLEDLCNDQSAMLEVLPDKRDEPFLVASRKGPNSGLDLTGANGKPLPALAQSLIDALANNAANAGLGRVDWKGIRKGTSNMIGCVAGAEVASIMLTHSPQHKTYSEYYSMSVANINIIGLLHGEVPPMLPFHHHDSVAEHHSLRSIAALYLVKRGDLPALQKLGRSKGSREFSEEERQQFEATFLPFADVPDNPSFQTIISKSAEIQSLIAQVDDSLQEWKDGSTSILGRCNPSKVQRVEDEAKASITVTPNTQRAFALLETSFGGLDSLNDDEKEMWQAGKTKVLTAQLALRKQYKALRRENARQKVRDARESWAPSKEIDTMDARLKAVAEMRKPGETSIQIARSIRERSDAAQESSASSLSVDRLNPQHLLPLPPMTTSPLDDCNEADEEESTVQFASLLSEEALEMIEDPWFDNDAYRPERNVPEDIGLSSSVRSLVKDTIKKIDEMDYSEEGVGEPSYVVTSSSPLARLPGYVGDGMVDSRRVFHDNDHVALFKDITVSEMNKELAVLILGPLFEQEARRREMDRNFEKYGERGLHCQICQEYPLHVGHGKIWPSFWKLKRHMKNNHSAWKDLRLRCLVGENAYKCFRCQSTFSGEGSINSLYDHFLQECPYAEEFIEICDEEASDDEEADPGTSSRPAQDRPPFPVQKMTAAAVRRRKKAIELITQLTTEDAAEAVSETETYSPEVREILVRAVRNNWSTIVDSAQFVLQD
ncbi:hypothetical protein FRB90_010997 [Tulasnella sp. 427]|nr:hypothetical protein FRB90_010997 [Tulasnella sp. 427]